MNPTRQTYRPIAKKAQGPSENVKKRHSRYVQKCFWLIVVVVSIILFFFQFFFFLFLFFFPFLLF
jgi:hypothetical protein